MEEKKSRGYALRIEKDITVSGVKKAIECTDSIVRLSLDSGVMTMCGKDLDIKKLDLESGEAVLSGMLDEITWGGIKGRRVLKKLLK